MTTEVLQTIKVIDVLNPLEVLSEQDIHWHEWREDKSLAEYIPGDCEYIVSVSGGIVVAAEWESYYPKSDDVIVCVPVLEGGGGRGKMILRLVAVIALAVFAPQIAGALLPGLSATTGIAIVNVVGGFLINALMPIQPASNSGRNDDLSESPTYGISGAANTQVEGIPVPVCYGSFRMAGNILGIYTENVERTQILYVLINAGEGPITSISDLEINGQPLEAYRDVEWQYRTGTYDQDPIDWFADTLEAQSVGIADLPNESPTVSAFRVTTEPCDRLRIDVVCPLGLIKTEDDGKTKPWTVPLQIAYIRVNSDGSPYPGATWQTSVQTVTTTGTVPRYEYPGGYPIDPGTGEPGPTPVPKSSSYNLDPGQFVGTGTGGTKANAIYEISTGKIVGHIIREATRPSAAVAGAVSITGKSRFPVRASFITPELPNGYYKVAVTRSNNKSTDDQIQDQVDWESLVRVTTADVAYRNTALLALKIRLTDQINSFPTITYICNGVKVRGINTTTGEWELVESGNPAWVALDMLTNTRYGGKLPLSIMDIPAFQRWAAFCDAQTPPLRYDAVMDQSMSIWDALRYVLRAGHANISRNGTRISIVLESPDTPAMMFSEQNVVKGSFNVNWLGTSERANAVELTYWDQDKNYERTTVKVIDPSLTDLSKEQVANLTLMGVTNRTQAIREAYLQININNYLTRTVSFEASLDAIACAVGSVIIVKHVANEYAASGRLGAIYPSGGNFITLDQQVTREAGSNYKLLLHTPAAYLASGLGVTAYPNNGSLRRFRVEGQTTSVAIDQLLQLFDGSVTLQNQSRQLMLSSATGSISLDIAKIQGVGIGSWDVDVYPPVAGWNGAGEVSPTTTWDLVATDVIAERNYAPLGLNLTTTTLNIAPTIPLTLSEDTHWVLGKTTEIKRLYRVVSIEGGATEFTRKISAIEYDERVYSATGPLPPPIDPDGGGLGDLILHVNEASIEANEIAVYEQGGNARFELQVSWDNPVPTVYDGAIVFSKTRTPVPPAVPPGPTTYLEPEEWETYAVVENSGLSFTAESRRPGDQIKFRILSKDVDGRTPPFSTAPEFIWIVGDGTTLDKVDVTSLKTRPNITGVTLTWEVDKPNQVARSEISYTYSPFDTPGSDPDAGSIIPVTRGLTYNHIGLSSGNYRYWVRVYDAADPEEPSDWFGGTTTRPGNSIDEILDAIGDTIAVRHLDSILRSRIEVIPSLVDYETLTDMVSQILRLANIVDTQQAEVLTAQQSVVTETEARASQFNILAAQFNDSQAAIIDERNVRATADFAEATAREALAVAITGTVDGSDVTGSSLISVERNARVQLGDDLRTEIEAEASERRILGVALTGDPTGQNIAPNSVIGTFVNVTSANATLTSAVVSDVEQLNAEVNGPGGAFARITSIDEALVNEVDGPIARQINQFAINRIDPIDDSITEIALEQQILVDSLGGTYTLRIDTNGYIAGFGLTNIDPTGPAPPTSAFVVNADIFRIASPAGPSQPPVSPFSVVTTPTTAPDGSIIPAGVYISNAKIGFADIGELQVARGSISQNYGAAGAETATFAVELRAGDFAIVVGTSVGILTVPQGGNGILVCQVKVDGVPWIKGSPDRFRNITDGPEPVDMSSSICGVWGYDGSLGPTKTFIFEVETVRTSGAGFIFSGASAALSVSKFKR